MAGISGSRTRKVFVAALATAGCLALLLFCSKLVTAEQLVASYYGSGFEGNLTANGEVFDPSDYTAAHKTYEFGTKLIVTYEGRSIVVRINDRGPYIAGRHLDLSQGAAEYLGLTSVGVDTVGVEMADPATPTGPYSPRTARQSTPRTNDARPNQNRQADLRADRQADRRAARQAEPAADRLDRPNRRQNDREEVALSEEVVTNQDDGQDVSVAEDQYVTEDQYDAEEAALQRAAPPPPAPPAPKPAVPVLPPEPEPEALESPPAELAVPNSTVQRRVELNVAAQPTVQPEPVVEETVEEVVAAEQPVEEPEASEEPESPKETEPAGEISMLPDTGGAPLIPLVAGGLLLSLGLVVRLLRR